MIVVDTNIIAYMYLPNEQATEVEKLLERHPVWAAPLLWKSEFRNILALYLRKRVISPEQAIQIQAEAESLMEGNEYDLSSIDVIRLVERSSCSAYDCEFIALAKHLNTYLITADKKILSQFPTIASSLEKFLK